MTWPSGVTPDPVAVLLPECPDDLRDYARPFVRAVLAEPEDATARLVFADWLNERDDARLNLRAELIWCGVELHARLGYPTLEPSEEYLDTSRRIEDAGLNYLMDNEMRLMKLLSAPSGGGYVAAPGGCDVHARGACVRPYSGEVEHAPPPDVPAVLNDRGFPGVLWATLGRAVLSTPESRASTALLPPLAHLLPVTRWHAPEFEPVMCTVTAAHGKMSPKSKLRRPWWCFAGMTCGHTTGGDGTFPFQLPAGLLDRLMRPIWGWYGPVGTGGVVDRGPESRNAAAHPGLHVAKDFSVICWQNSTGRTVIGWPSRGKARAELSRAAAEVLSARHPVLAMHTVEYGRQTFLQNGVGDPVAMNEGVRRLTARWEAAVFDFPEAVGVAPFDFPEGLGHHHPMHGEDTDPAIRAAFEHSGMWPHEQASLYQYPTPGFLV